MTMGHRFWQAADGKNAVIAPLFRVFCYLRIAEKCVAVSPQNAKLFLSEPLGWLSGYQADGVEITGKDAMFNSILITNDVSPITGKADTCCRYHSISTFIFE